MSLVQTLQQFVELNLPPSNCSHCSWVVGYSGGLDSHALLHGLSRVVSDFPNVTLRAVHVNHQLQEDADSWATHCQKVADQLSVPLIIEQASIDLNHGGGLEAAAREARYQVFKANLGERDVLFLAHHQEDQVETLLLRLMRGSGATGLAAMAPNRRVDSMHLMRPLLDTRRADIERYGEQHQLNWIEDPSNQDLRYDRNFVRREVLPLLKSRWPAAVSNMARSAELLRLESLQLEMLIAPLLAEAVDAKRRLDIDYVQTLPELTQGQLVRGWLKQLNLPYPSQVNLQRILEEVIQAPQDGQPLVRWGDTEVRRYEHRLYGMTAQEPFDTTQILDWDFPSVLRVSGIGCLCVEPAKGFGLRRPLGPDEKVTVRFRQGGEKCRPLSQRHGLNARTKNMDLEGNALGSRGKGLSAGKNRPLKKLLQEYRIQPWLRDRTPLIYYGDQLAAVVGGWVCEGFAVPDGQAGFEIKLLSEKVEEEKR